MGRNDALIPPAYAEQFRTALPHSEDVFWLEDCGHEPPLEQMGKAQSARDKLFSITSSRSCANIER